jgi:thiol-disulfide isomerase/thioredoxin
MTLTLCAALLQTFLLAAPADTNETYTEAHRQTAESGKPIVVMVSTDWCGPCQAMKRNVLPKLREHGLFKKVCFAQVNADKESDLAKELTGGGPVPQMVMYCKTDKGWFRRKLIGGQSVEKVEEFIKEGLVSKDDDQKADKSSSEKDTHSPVSLTKELPEEHAKSPATRAG